MCASCPNVHMGVSMFGGGGFMESQELYCECAKESGVQQHYEDLFFKLLQIIYKLDEGEIREKVSTIIPSTDDGGSKLTNKNSHKLFRTFYKLMKKYPHSIHHVLSRGGQETHHQYHLRGKRATQSQNCNTNARCC